MWCGVVIRRVVGKWVAGWVDDTDSFDCDGYDHCHEPETRK